MKKRSKRAKEFDKLVEKNKAYTLKDAVDILKKAPKTKFDESIDLNVKLDIDPKQTSQMVRGTVSLPKGTGKKLRVAVFCKGEAEKQAKEAGADFIGAMDLIEKVNSGWADFDVAISTPDMMKDVGKLGKVLGPRGLMPNPKTGTVTQDVKKAIEEIKKGKIEFKMDKQSSINCGLGKLSFENSAIEENARALINAIVHAKPASLKGQYIKNISISSTMGPGIKLDLSEFKG